MRILAIGAHPDDLEIFFYGLLAALSLRGDEVALAVATDGAAGTVDGPDPALAAKRAEETRLGLADIGVPVMLGLPDGRLAVTPHATEIIAGHIRQISPDMIITHDPADYHTDHRCLSQIVSQNAGFSCPILYGDTLMGVGFVPDFYVDITAHFAAKQKAIHAHHSQQPDRFAEAVALHNRFRAAQCNAPSGHYAECYRTQRRFPFADIRAMLPPPPPYRPFYTKGAEALI